METTECVRMNFPRQNFQDAIIWLHVECALEIATLLFPRTSQKLLALLSTQPEGQDTEGFEIGEKC